MEEIKEKRDIGDGSGSGELAARTSYLSSQGELPMYVDRLLVYHIPPCILSIGSGVTVRD